MADHAQDIVNFQSPEESLFTAPVSSPLYAPATAKFLSNLSQATQSTFDDLRLPLNFDQLVVNKDGEDQVRQGFAAQALLEKQKIRDEFAIDRIIQGAGPAEVESILGGRPFNEVIEDTAKSVLEKGAAKWLVDQGLMTEERATVVINEEFAFKEDNLPSKTNKREEFLATLFKMQTLRNKVAEAMKDDTLRGNISDFIGFTLFPFYTSVSSGKVVGRDVERLGASILKFSREFWAMSFDERMAKLDQFAEDLENNALEGGQNVFAAAVQLDQLLSMVDEDQLGVNLIETLDASIVGVAVSRTAGSLYRMWKGLKAISSAGRAAGWTGVTPGRAVTLRNRDQGGFGKTIEGEFTDITPSAGQKQISGQKLLTAAEEDELVTNMLPSSGTIHAGPPKAAGATGQVMDKIDVMDEFQKIIPDMTKEVNRLGIAKEAEDLSPTELVRLLHRTMVPEILNATEQGTANLAAMKVLMRRFGFHPSARDLVNPELYTGGAVTSKLYPVFDVRIDEVSGIRTIVASLGTGEGFTKGYTSKAAAEAGAERLGIAKGFFEVSESTGEFFIEVSRNPGTTQYISPIDPSEIPRTMPGVSAALFGPSTTNPLDAIKGARLSVNAESILMTALVKAARNINPRTTPKGPGLSKKAKKTYDELMMDIHQNEKWKTVPQVVEWYQKHHQRRPTDRELLAYEATREIYEFNYLIHNNRLKNELIGLGYQELMINGLFKSPTLGKEVATTSLLPNQVRIYDTIQSKMVGPETKGDLTELLNRGEDLILVKLLTRSKKFGDYIIVPRQDVNQRALRAQMLNKIDGPNRIYDGSTFIKQQKVRTIGGRPTIVNPKTHFVVKGTSEGKKWVDAYNDALIAFRTAEDSGSALDKAFASEVISKNTIFSGYDEMLKTIEDGQMERTPFEALKSGEHPTYREPGVQDMAIDPEFNSLSDEVQIMIQNGRLVYSSRGPRLLHPDGSLAPLLHADDIMAQISRSAVSTQSYNNHKIRQIHKWVSTYDKYLVPQPGRSVEQKFMFGVLDDSTQAPVRISGTTLREANLSRANLKRLLSNRGLLAQSVERYKDEIIDLIDNRANSNVADRAADILSKDPVVFLRGDAFKAYLGFGDISQLLVQTSMTPGVIATSPVAGGKALLLFPIMRALMVNPLHIKAMAKRVGRAKIMPEKMFEQMMDDMDQSGVTIIGRNQSELDNMSREGEILGTGGAFLRRSTDAAMLAFNEAEKFVRTIGYSMAWQEFFAKSGRAPKSIDEKAAIMVRANALAGNMTRDGKAWWQEGTIGLATQFVAQPFRLFELLFLPTPGGFKLKDKVRMYIGLALAFGPTLGLRGDQSAPGSMTEVIKQWYFEANGTEIPEALMRSITDGLVGALLSDTDISRFQPFGQGTLLADFFNPNKGIDIWNMLGASGSMLNTFYNATIGSAKLWAFMNGKIDADLMPLTLMDIANDTAKTIISYNRVQKAIHAYQTKEYISSRGELLQRDIDTFDAAMIGLGLPPMESKAAMESRIFIKDFKEKAVKDGRRAAFFFQKAMNADKGSRVQRMNLAFVAQLRDLYVDGGDYTGAGATLFAGSMDQALADSGALTEKVRSDMNNILFRDPSNLHRGKE